MPIYIIIFAIIIVLYGFFTTVAIIGFNRLRGQVAHKKENTISKDLFFSIVVSMRNEAENIQEFLFQLEKQSFAKQQFELIIINDASEDDTLKLLEQCLTKSTLNYQIIQQSSHKGKKYNIAKAIEMSKGDVIITTDADVVYRHIDWLKNIAEIFNNTNTLLLIMPIDFIKTKGFLSIFQLIENFALTAITAGYAGLKMPFLCNGANLAFTKKAFLQVNGYDSHMHISSGEDVFLLESLKKLPSFKINYVVNRVLIVKTKPITEFHAFINQRIRWAYKAKYNTNILNLLAGLLIISANLIFLVLAVSIVKQSVAINYLSIFAIAKLIFDFLLLFLASDFLGSTKKLIWLLPFEFIYWLYSLLVGVLSIVVKPIWKGKKVN